jgi:hypothetical protein
MMEVSHCPSGRPRHWLTLPSSLLTRVVEPDRWRRRCGCGGAARDTTIQRWRTNRSAGGPDFAGHGPPLPVFGLWACVATGHVEGRRAAGETVPARVAVGVGRVGVSAPDCGPDRRKGSTCPGRPRTTPSSLRAANADQRSGPVRRCHRRRVRRTHLEAHPARRQVRHRNHRPDRHRRPALRAATARARPAARHDRKPSKQPSSSAVCAAPVLS